MNEEEKKFLSSIENKIKEYRLRTTLARCLELSGNDFIITQYNDGTEEKVNIEIERHMCSISPLYFIKKYAWIPFPGLGIIPFKTYYFQDNILEDLLDYKKIVCEKVRQCGLSTLFSLYCLWRALFKSAEYIDIVSLKQLKAQAFVSKMKATLEFLPPFLKIPITKDNQQVLEFANGSTIVSESQSDNAGRSDSLSVLVLDEAAHYRTERMVRAIVAAAQPTLSRTNGQLLVLSTPNKTSGPGAYYYEQVVQAKMGMEINTKLISVDWWEVPDVAELGGAKKGYNQILKRYIEQDYYRALEVKKRAKEFFDPIAENAWRENPWLKKQHDDLNDILYKQEILHNFIVGGNAVFTDDILKRMEERVKDPIEENKLGTNRIDGLWTWKKPIPRHRYILAVDISTGTGNDSSSIEVLDVGEYEQVAEYKGFMSTKMFGKIVKLVANYYNQAFVVIECNSVGEAVFNEVYYSEIEPYENVYKQKKTKNNITRMTGWITDSKTRKLITDELINWLSVDDLWDTLKLYSKRVYIEACTWIWDGSKPDHDTGSHDDTLIALSLALYLRNKAIDTGESFIISEKGEYIEYDKKKDGLISDKQNTFDVVSTEEHEEEDDFQKLYGVDRENYMFLTGQK
jgi:hypothetical protein